MADDKKFTEDAYERTLIALFRDELGYAYECGYEVERDYKEPFYRADLVASMRLNCQPMQWRKASSKSPISASEHLNRTTSSLPSGCRTVWRWDSSKMAKNEPP